MLVVIIILMSMAMSADALFFGMAFGAKGIRIRGFSLVLITVTGFAVLLISEILGHYLSDVLKYGELIGSFILIGTGMWLCSDSKGVLDSPEKADINRSKNIEPWEAIITGVLLSIDSSALVIGASVGNDAMKILPVFILLFQIVFIFAGMTLGVRSFDKIPQKTVSILSGFIIVLIGLYRLSALFC